MAGGVLRVGALGITKHVISLGNGTLRTMIRLCGNVEMITVVEIAMVVIVALILSYSSAPRFLIQDYPFGSYRSASTGVLQIGVLWQSLFRMHIYWSWVITRSSKPSEVQMPSAVLRKVASDLRSIPKVVLTGS